MSGIISKISLLALAIIAKAGYVGIFILSAVESCGIPIPSEVVVPFSGFLAVSGRFSFWLVVFVATFGNLIGSIVLFFIGKYGGRWVLEKYGKYVFVSQHDLEIGDRWFEKHGAKAILIGRILPIARTFVSLSGGVAKMNFYKFSIYTILGSLPWNFALALIGYKAGENWNILSPYFHKVEYFIIVAVVIIIIFYIYRHVKNKYESR